MRISDWSSDVCSSDLEHLEIIDNAWHHRLDAGLIGRLLEFEADAQLQEARLASPAVEADQHLVEIVVIVRSRGLVVGSGAAEQRIENAAEVDPGDRKSTRLNSSH